MFTLEYTRWPMTRWMNTPHGAIVSHSAPNTPEGREKLAAELESQGVMREFMDWCPESWVVEYMRLTDAESNS